MAKSRKGLSAPFEDAVEELLDKCRLGDAVITRMDSNADPTGLTVTVEFMFTRSGQPQLARPMNLGGVSITKRKPMDFKTGPMPLKARTSDEVYIGYRDFVWKPDHNRLASRNGFGWPPYKHNYAVCQRGKRHDAPHEHCECGIYAFNTADHPHLDVNAFVWGEVALWGDVLVCDSGYRAEYAYPQTLFMRDDGLKVTKHIRDTIEQTYGVPVHLVQHRAGQTADQIIQKELEKLVIDFASGKSTKNPLDPFVFLDPKDLNF